MLSWFINVALVLILNCSLTANTCAVCERLSCVTPFASRGQCRPMHPIFVSICIYVIICVYIYVCYLCEMHARNEQGGNKIVYSFCYYFRNVYPLSVR